MEMHEGRTGRKGKSFTHSLIYNYAATTGSRFCFLVPADPVAGVEVAATGADAAAVVLRLVPLVGLDDDDDAVDVLNKASISSLPNTYP
jgi:hypothetical protein